MDQTGDTSQHSRPIRWQADHDNGWRTVIVQQHDGSFAAWMTSGEERSPPYVDLDIYHAYAAVMASLYRHTGHRTCTDGCSDWQLHLR